MEETLVKKTKDEKVLSKYSRDEVYQATLDYFNGDTLATEVWINKYCLKDSDGNLYEKTPDDMHWRLANEFARIENKYPNLQDNKNHSDYGKKRSNLTKEIIFDFFKKFKYVIPQGSVMNILGNQFMIGSLSNCIVLPKIHDSYGGIMYTDQQLAQLYKRRCGVGLDISTLRPEGMAVTNAAGSTTGAVSFMERFSNTTREVGQCLIFNTSILTKNGLKEIKNVNKSDEVWTRIGWVKVLDVINNGKKEVYKVKTKRGFEIISTKNHIYLNKNNEETKLKNFNIGDQIVLLEGTTYDFEELELLNTEYVSTQPKNFNNLNEFKFPKKLNKNLAYLIGYSYGDGHFSYEQGKACSLNLSVAKKDIDILIKLKNIVKEEFKYDVKIYDGSGDVYVLEIRGVKFCNWLIHNKINKEKTKEIKIPNKIKISNSEIQMSFFSGYFDADGCAHKTGRNIRVTSICKNFIYETQKILLANGIISNIQTHKSKKDNRNTEYRLNIQGKFSQNLLCEKTQSIKLSKMERVSLSDNILSPYTHKDFDEIKNFRKNHSYIPTYNDRKISFSSLNRLYEEINVDKNMSFLDEIVSIERYGNYETYDLVLEKEHLFWANGFYVHNSGRRGALMITIDVRHPDVEKFAKIKEDLKKVTGANISIKLTDDFMNAVINNSTYTLRFPVDSDPQNALLTKEINAKKLWDIIVNTARNSAEPGLIFWDRQHKYSTSSVYPNWENVSTNPCSEIAMNNDSCRLIAINYLGFVKNPFTENAEFNYDKLYEISYESQRLMDNLVDLELESVENILKKVYSDPEPDNIKEIEIETWKQLYKTGKEGRRTGLGFTALADTLAALGLKFDSNEALKVIEKINRTKLMGEFDSSIDMGIERGKFKDFNPEIEETSDFVQMLKKEFPIIYDRMMKFGRRNISISTVAPTGSLSILAQTSSGIEPVYLLGYKRRRKINPSDKETKIDFVDDLGDSWQEYNVFHPKAKDWAKINNVDENKILTDSPYIGSTAPEIDWIKRVKIQSIVQKYVTHSISSTINLPSDVTVDKVSEIYIESWKMGLKGITVYRDGSRSGVLVSSDEKKEKEKKKLFEDNHAPKRPKRLNADIVRFQNNHEKWVAVVGLLDNRPYEIFTGKLSNGLSELSSSITKCEVVKNKDENGNKSYDIEYIDSNKNKHVYSELNNTFNPEYWNYSKMISGVLRHGMPLVYVLNLIQSLNLDDDHLNTWKNGVARVIKRYIKDGDMAVGMKCENCGSKNVVFKEGCAICMDCGSSKCS